MRVAVVTGRHVFEVVAFHQMLRNLEGFDSYVQHMEDFCADNGKDRDRYDAVLFFHMLLPTPTGDEPWPAGSYKLAIEQIPLRKQGVVLLHHSLVGWPDWPLWSELVGIHARKTNKVSFGDVGIHVEDANHPITRGLSDWVMWDEMYSIPEPGDDSQVLLTTSTPGSMRKLAWTRQVGAAKIVCIQSGHDHVAWTNPNWQRLLTQSLRWGCMTL